MTPFRITGYTNGSPVVSTTVAVNVVTGGVGGVGEFEAPQAASVNSDPVTSVPTRMSMGSSHGSGCERCALNKSAQVPVATRTCLSVLGRWDKFSFADGAAPSR